MHDPPRILIVDDNATNRDILAVRLATQGYDLHHAADGEEALAAAQPWLVWLGLHRDAGGTIRHRIAASPGPGRLVVNW